MDHAFLKITDSTGVRQIPLVQKQLTIGRHKNNTVALTDQLASRFHCVIEKTPEGFVIRDLQSSNGTLLNGQRVLHATLSNDDVITIGSTHIIFSLRPSPVLGKPHGRGALPPKKPASAPVMAQIAPDQKNQPEVLGEEDVIDDLEVVEPGIQIEVDEPQSANDIFQSIADAIPNKFFDIDAIELINTRGKSIMETGQKSYNRGENINLFKLVLLICFRSNASDIHLEPRSEDYLMRIRVDGTIIDLTRLTKEMGVKLCAIVKVLCDLDTTQKSIVQEGHFAARAPYNLPPDSKNPTAPPKIRRVDYRVSFVPTLYGQKLVTRVFDTANAPRLVEDLQLPPALAGEVSKQLALGSNIILVCGPTGSGKTTTLYSLLRSAGVTHRNILTIEDPVEVQIEGTTQLPVDEANGKSFAALLRSSLRQDPDIIMVGEIRDPETAKIALQAAITGHLVFSSVHTRDTIGTIFRLLDLGCEPFMVSQGLHLLIAQRLVRKLCLACRRPFKPGPEEFAKLGPGNEKVRTLYAPSGCPKCLGSGFAGRRAVFEILPVTDAIRDCITKNPSHSQLLSLLGPEFVPLTKAGYQLVAEGITSFDEIDRAVGA